MTKNFDIELTIKIQQKGTGHQIYKTGGRKLKIINHPLLYVLGLWIMK